MPEVEILLPKMGESVAEATIVTWLKKEGDSVEADEPIIEIATDKVDSEVPAPEDGVLVKHLCQEGDVVEVGQPIAIIRIGGEAAAPASSAPASAEAKPVAQPVAASPQSNGSDKIHEPVMTGMGEPISKSGPSGRFYSPLVRNIAEKEGIAMHELEQIR